MNDLKLISNSNIDRQKWDKAILQSGFPLVYAQSFYLDATCKNWKALVLNDYESVMPVTEGKKLNIKYLYQPPFTPQLGVYGKKSSISNDFISFIVDRYKFIDIELNASNNTLEHKTKDKITYFIELDKEFKQNENTKRNISKARKNNIKIEEIQNIKEAKELALNHLLPWLNKELKISRQHCDLFIELISNAFKANALKVFVARNNEELLSIGYFINNNYHSVFLKGMSFNKKDNSGSMHLLLDHAIQYFKGKSKIFDFGGGNSKGLANFYKGLGGKELTYHILKVNKLPWPVKLLKK